MHIDFKNILLARLTSMHLLRKAIKLLKGIQVKLGLQHIRDRFFFQTFPQFCKPPFLGLIRTIPLTMESENVMLACVAKRR